MSLHIHNKLSSASI